MTTNAALHAPEPETRETRAIEPASAMQTYRIEVEKTGRVLLQGFHVEVVFTDAPDGNLMVAEFGEPELAFRVIEKLRYRVPLIVRMQHWPAIEGTSLGRLCRRVSDTGASANMLLWNPAFAPARAQMDMPRAGKGTSRW